MSRRNDNIIALFESSQVGPPPIKKDAPTPNLTGTLTLKTDFNSSIGFLEGLKNLIGVNLAVKYQYNNDDALVFSFENPQLDQITSFVELDRFINTSKVIDGSFGEALKDSDIYIITAVLKSNKFSVGIVDTSKHGGNLDLPNIKGLIDSDLTLDRNKNEKRGMEYAGATPLVFGVQAVQLLYDKPALAWLTGKKGVFRIKESVGMIVRKSEKVKVTTLTTPDNMLRLE